MQITTSMTYMTHQTIIFSYNMILPATQPCSTEHSQLKKDLIGWRLHYF